MRRFLATLAGAAIFCACGDTRLIDVPPAPRYDDFMDQAKASKIDILFVVDNSGSMGNHQRLLADNFRTFLDYLDPDTRTSGEPNEVDYRLAVTTSDANNDKGELQGTVKIVYPGGGFDPLTTFQNNVRVGITGSSYEQGLYSAELGLQKAAAQPAIKGDKAFLRDGAYLYVIVVSDENDSSFGDPYHYERVFNQMKGLGDTQAVVVSAVAGPVDGSCATASPGIKYKTITEDTHGFFGSICVDQWSDTLQQLAVSGIGLQRIFQLKFGPKNLVPTLPPDDPYSADIEVSIHYPCDGGDYTRYFSTCAPKVSKLTCPANDPKAEMVCYPPHSHTDGWYYDADTISIIFNGKALPGPGSRVLARYFREGVN